MKFGVFHPTFDQFDPRCLILNISLWAQKSWKLAGVWTTEMQQKKILTIIYPGIVCWASCSTEAAYFIAIKLHSFPPESWPCSQFATHGHWASYFLSWSGGSIRRPSSLHPCSQGKDDSSVGNTGLTHLKYKGPEPKALTDGSNKDVERK